MRVSAIVFVFVILFLPAASVGDEYYDSMLNKGIKDSDPDAYLLIEKAGINRHDAQKLLSEAAIYAPSFPETYFELAKANFAFSGSAVLGTVDYFIHGCEEYASNFWWSFRLVQTLFFTLVVSLLFAIAITVITRIFPDLRIISHDIRESIINASALVVLAAASALSPLLFLACMLCLIGFYLKKSDKLVVYIYLVFLIFTPVIFKLGSFFLHTDTSGEIKAISQVNESKGNAYALSVLGGKDNGPALFSYALALKREGRYTEAIEAYERLISKQPSARAYVNLGNCYVGLYGFSEDKKPYLKDAVRAYQSALSLSQLTSAYYNLSQVSRELLDFDQGDLYFKSALAQDRAAVATFRNFSGRSPNRFVVDETFDSGEIMKQAKQTAPRPTSFGLSLVPLSFVSVFACVLLIAFYFLNVQSSFRAFRCRKCGTIICDRCEQRLTWGHMCPQCYASLVKLDELDARERISRLLSIYGRQRFRRNFLKALSFILPGTADILAGRVLYGFFTIWSFVFFVFLPFGARLFFPFLGSASLQFYHLGCWGIAAIIYLLSNMTTRRRIAFGWL